jgi:hypothetical protein
MDQTVGSFGSRTEAELARQLLEGAGIHARLRADDAGGLHPELGQVGMYRGITLIVADDQVEEARELLAAVAPEPEDWEEPIRATPGTTRGPVLMVVLLIVVLLLTFTVIDAVTGLG